MKTCTTLLQLVGVVLATTTALSEIAGSQVTEVTGVVAFIDKIAPPNVRLTEVARVRRRGQDLVITSNSLDLLPGDQIFMNRGDAALVVRILASNQRIIVRRSEGVSRADVADLTIKQPSLPGLRGGPLAWFEGVLRGADQTGDGSAVAASRAVNTGICYNDSGKTNEPIPFQIPSLRANSSVLAAGRRALYVSWRGGAPPFSVRMSSAENGRIIVEAVSVRDACAVYLPPVEFLPGQYRLTVTDANNVEEQEDNLFVAPEAPTYPVELRDAGITEEARDIYAATWLTVLDGGKWAFEAQQRVAAMDCRSPAVQDWLRQWGGVTRCVRH
jgi:hypothetical protein